MGVRSSARDCVPGIVESGGAQRGLKAALRYKLIRYPPDLHIQNLGAEDDAGNDSRDAGNDEEHPNLREGLAS